MTLAGWCKRYKQVARPYGKLVGGKQALVVFTDSFDFRDFHTALWDLAHLSDYALSSNVSGPQAVMVPRPRSRGRYRRP